jgi:prepilin-type N-terminal cleavage/methylation domain-containing protein
MIPLKQRAAMRGFTLIELMIALTIVAILAVVGLPSLSDFVAEQRVRTSASDLVSEIAFARAKAIESSRRVIMERLGVNWDQGWRTYIDVNNNATYEAGTDIEIKRFDGFGTGAASASGRLYSCSPVADFATNIIFRPDGRVVRSTTATTAADGIYIIDPMGDTDICNNKTRGVLFDLSGRVNSRLITSGTSSCRGVAPPC